MGGKRAEKSPPPKTPALQATCPDIIGDPPADWVGQLPPGVPPLEGPTATAPLADKMPVSTWPAGPARFTWYFPLLLEGAYPTGVFIPKGFSYGRDVDVILFFHGNKRGRGLSPFQYINEYWHGKYYNVDLRGDLNDSRMNAILVAPTMGDFPGHGLGSADLGIFKEPGAGDCFLRHVMQWLGTVDPNYASKGGVPQVRKVVLAGHSGGGSAIYNQMLSMNSNICEIWGFDIVYGDANGWIWFAINRRNIKIYLHSAIQSLDTLNEIAKLKDDLESGKTGTTILLNNLQIPPKNTLHYDALTKNFRERLRLNWCFSPI
jgi:hypothetical protein